MLENINYALFALLNATPASPQWAIEVAIFIAKDLILIVPLLVVTLWLWGPAQRQMAFVDFPVAGEEEDVVRLVLEFQPQGHADAR